MNRIRPQWTNRPGVGYVRRLLSLSAVAVISAAAALLLPLAPAENAQAQQPTPTATPSTLVRVSPTSQTVTAGSDVFVDIYVDGVASLAAYEFELAFQSNVMTYVSVTNGPFLGSTGRAVTCLPPLLGEGTVRYGCLTFAPPPPDGPTGSGLLATVRLGTSCSGISSLNLNIANLSETLGASIPTNTQSGSVTITGGGVCPTPTPTPTPGAATPTPTPTPTATNTPAGPTPTPVPQLCAPSAGASFCILPVSQTTFSGANVTFQIGVDGASNFGAFQFDLVYDSALLTSVSAIHAPFLGSTGRTVVCVPEFDPGRVQLICSTLGTAPPGPDGAGIIADVTLRALDLATGVTPLSLENTLLITIEGTSIPVISNDSASLTIDPAPTPTITPTPTPTATVPTPTPPATPTPGPSTIVRVSPNTQGVSAGSDVVIDIAIDAVADMGAFEFTLDYDPALLSFISAVNGPFIGSTGGAVFCIGPTVNAVSGAATFGCVMTGAPGATGSGTLATVTFGTSCAGNDLLSLTGVAIADGVGAPIPAANHNGSVGVGGGSGCPTPGPTATAMATATPAPPAPTPSTVVRIDPTSQGVSEGANAAVDIVIESVTSIGAYEFTVAFDPTLFSFLSFIDGPFLTSTGGSANCAGPTVNVVLGTATFGCVMTGASGPSGSGILATLTLATFCGGNGPLTLTQSDLRDTSTVSIPVATQNGSVTVLGSTTCPTPIPTATPAATATSTPTAPPSAATVRINPASQGVSIGTDVAVDIRAEDVSDLGAFDFTLVYNPTLLGFSNVTTGPFLASTGGTVNCVGPVVSPTLATVQYACIMSGAPGVAGSGVLATVSLSTSCSGVSTLILANADIADTLGTPIPRSLHNGTATVLGTTTCPTLTPTSTPTPGGPTSTPTATPTPITCGAAVVFILCPQPQSQTVNLSSETILEVAVANAPELGAFQFTLRYDPLVVSAPSVSPGPFLSSTSRIVTCLVPTAGPGFIQYTCVSIEPTPAGPTGTGVLAFITLRGEAAGISLLTFEDVIFTDVPGLAYPTAALGVGEITVVEGATPTPTLSPTATLSPTPTVTPTPCPGGICPTPTVTPTPTITPTPTDTPIPPPTATFTPTPTSTTPAGPVTIRIDPVSQNAPVGTIVTADIVVDNVADLGAFQFMLSYSPSVILSQSLVVGPFLGSTGRNVVCLPPIVGVSDVEFSCNTIGTTPPGANGSGVIATATFFALAEGLSPLHLSGPIIVDVPGAAQLPIVTQDGVVIVIPPATPTPVATPTPTPTVTPTATPGIPSLNSSSLTTTLRTVAITAHKSVAYPGVTGPAGVQSEQDIVSVIKEPAESNLFLGNGSLVLYERAQNVPEGSGLGGFELHVAYDNNTVSLDIDASPFLQELEGTDRTATCLENRTEGAVRFGCVTTGVDPGPSGTFAFARITVTPLARIPIRPAPNNGIEVILDDVTANTRLVGALEDGIPVSFVGDAKVIVRALESDINVDCAVNVIDHQMVAGRFGVSEGSTLYQERYDLEPAIRPDGDIDISDLQTVYGRTGSTCAQPWGIQDPPSKSTETPTPSVTPEATATPGPTGETPSSTPTASPSPQPTATVTTAPATATAAATATATATPGGAGAGSPTPDPTVTSTATATPALTATDTPAPSTTPEPSATPDGSGTPVPTSDASPTATHTWTPQPTWTQEPTWTPVPTWTAEPTWTPAIAAIPTPTPTTPPPPTATVIPLPTFGTPAVPPTSTPAPANTATPVPAIPPTDTPAPGAPPSTATPAFIPPTDTPAPGAPPSTATPASPTGSATPIQAPVPTSTPTLVRDSGPILKTPVAGLPDTGGADGSSGDVLPTTLAIAGLAGGAVLLAWSQLLWWRRRQGVTPAPFQPRFRPAPSRRQEDTDGPR